MGNSFLIHMKSLILATTAALAIISSIYIFSQNNGSSRLLSKPEDVKLSAWTKWKMTYGKAYGNNSEEEFRKAVFMEHYIKVNTHNSLMGRSYDMALNQFTDLPAD